MAHEKLRIKQSRKELNAMCKEDFITVFETTLLCANLDVIALSLIDEDHVQITFKGNGKRVVNIGADSYGAIILDVMKYVF